MTEQRLHRDNKVQKEWVICPTCRQRTDFGNIAYADDRQNMLHLVQGCEKSEASTRVQGSYGTKVNSFSNIFCYLHTGSQNRYNIFETFELIFLLQK